MPPPAAENGWQRLWFSLLQRPWSSLVIVPCDAGPPALPVAEALVAVGRLHGEPAVRMLNAEGMRLGDVRALLEDLRAAAGSGELVVIPVDPIDQNPVAIAVAHAASATLLVVRLGTSRLAAARRTIELVGRERLIGSLALD